MKRRFGEKHLLLTENTLILQTIIPVPMTVTALAQCVSFTPRHHKLNLIWWSTNTLKSVQYLGIMSLLSLTAIEVQHSKLKAAFQGTLWRFLPLLVRWRIVFFTSDLVNMHSGFSINTLLMLSFWFHWSKLGCGNAKRSLNMWQQREWRGQLQYFKRTTHGFSLYYWCLYVYE